MHAHDNPGTISPLPANSRKHLGGALGNRTNIRTRVRARARALAYQRGEATRLTRRRLGSASYGPNTEIRRMLDAESLRGARRASEAAKRRPNRGDTRPGLLTIDNLARRDARRRCRAESKRSPLALSRISSTASIYVRSAYFAHRRARLHQHLCASRPIITRAAVHTRARIRAFRKNFAIAPRSTRSSY